VYYFKPLYINMSCFNCNHSWR